MPILQLDLAPAHSGCDLPSIAAHAPLWKYDGLVVPAVLPTACLEQRVIAAVYDRKT